MLIGYSFWGFLGPGIRDTPDGGRSHRRTLVDGLRARGHDIVFLQANRDLLEAGDDLAGRYRWDSGLPELDALFLEWRWPIPGRTTTPRAGHAPCCGTRTANSHPRTGCGASATWWCASRPCTRRRERFRSCSPSPTTPSTAPTRRR